MAAGLGTNLGKGRELRAVLIHVRLARAAKVAQGQWYAVVSDQGIGLFFKSVKGAGAIVEDRAQRAGSHLLEAKRKHTICSAAGDGLTRQKQRG